MNRPMRGCVAALVGSTFLAAGCSGLLRPAAQPPPRPGGAGRAFAERACAGCHAIDRAGESPNPRAPTFRDLARQRSDAELMSALGEISRDGHLEMPPIYVTPDEMRAVIGWMRSLSAQKT